MQREFLELFREIGRAVRGELLEVFGTLKAQEKLKKGAFGDLTVYIDKKAEEILLEKVRASSFRCSVLSEEVGLVSFGGKFPMIIADPIDGSLNAKRGIPYFSVSLALSEGESTDDVTVGYVINLSNGDEFSAVKGEGSYLNGTPIKSISKGFSMAVVEGLKMDTDVELISFLFKHFYRVRQMGSMALDLCYLARGSFDVLFSVVPSRIVDYAAGMLILNEADGGMFDWETGEEFSGKVGMEKSSRFFSLSRRDKLEEILKLMEPVR